MALLALYIRLAVVAAMVGGATALVTYGIGHSTCQLEAVAAGEAGPIRYRPFRGCERFDTWSLTWVALPPAPEAL